MKTNSFFRIVLATIPMWGISVITWAQDVTSVEVLTVEQLPKTEEFLPEPPSLTDPLFFNDFVQYQKGKELRDTERGQLATADALITTEYYMARFGKAMGKDLTPKAYPNLATYIQTAYTEARSALESAKNHFNRMRPFYQFNEPSGIPENEDELLKYQSYPSGHTVRAWAIALALVGVDPDHQNEILKIGYEMGQSRAISGYHYQSDIDAARVAASAIFARLSVEPLWQELLKKAKAEFESGQTSEKKKRQKPQK